MRRAFLGFVCLLAAAGCGGHRASGPPPVVATPASDLLGAADPKLPGFDLWPLSFKVGTQGRTELRCRMELVRAATTLATIEAPVALEHCRANWNGRAEAGTFVAPGPLDVRLSVLDAAGANVLADATATIDVVRLGISEVRFSGAPGAQQPLMYSSMAGMLRGS